MFLILIWFLPLAKDLWVLNGWFYTSHKETFKCSAICKVWDIMCIYFFLFLIYYWCLVKCCYFLQTPSIKTKQLFTHFCTSLSVCFLCVCQVINGLLERPDWEEAIQTPLGILPGGSGNALAASIHQYSRWIKPKISTLCLVLNVQVCLWRCMTQGCTGSRFTYTLIEFISKSIWMINSSKIAEKWLIAASKLKFYGKRVLFCCCWVFFYLNSKEYLHNFMSFSQPNHKLSDQ